jgi:glutaredoxin-like protein
MTLLSNEDRRQVETMFGELSRPVRLLFFRQDLECPTCNDTQAILNELSGLSDRLDMEVIDAGEDPERAEQYRIDKFPAIVLLAADDPDDVGVRYYGIPSGYEFSSLIDDVLMMGAGDSGLADRTRQELASLTEPVHIQVFVTPTCPYCPRAVRLAHQMALESPMVTADMVEAIEFSELSQRYGVMGVPRTVINDVIHIEGALPEAMVLPKVLEAAQA